MGTPSDIILHISNNLGNISTESRTYPIQVWVLSCEHDVITYQCSTPFNLFSCGCGRFLTTGSIVKNKLQEKKSQDRAICNTSVLCLICEILLINSTSVRYFLRNFYSPLPTTAGCRQERVQNNLNPTLAYVRVLNTDPRTFYKNTNSPVG